MCFSAEASFALGAGLAVVGVMTLRKKVEKRDLPFLAFPLVFAAQQISEGFLWLEISAGRDGAIMAASSFLFVFFAEVIWPALVPLSVWLIEREEKRRAILRFLVPWGFIVAGVLFYKMLLTPYEAQIVGHSIQYTRGTEVTAVHLLGYSAAVVLPLLLSSKRLIALFGATVVIALLVTSWAYRDAYISVWCFFAAILSAIVWAWALQEEKTSGLGADRRSYS